MESFTGKSDQLIYKMKDFPLPLTHRIHVWYINANIWGILMVNVTIYGIHGSYGVFSMAPNQSQERQVKRVIKSGVGQLRGSRIRVSRSIAIAKRWRGVTLDRKLGN